MSGDILDWVKTGLNNDIEFFGDKLIEKDIRIDELETKLVAAQNVNEELERQLVIRWKAYDESHRQLTIAQTRTEQAESLAAMMKFEMDCLKADSTGVTHLNGSSTTWEEASFYLQSFDNPDVEAYVKRFRLFDAIAEASRQVLSLDQDQPNENEINELAQTVREWEVWEDQQSLN